MIEILVNFRNIITKEEYYFKRWLNIIDIILEKDKGLRWGKL